MNTDAWARLSDSTCWKENRGSSFKSPHIPALRYSRVKIGEFHGSKKVYGYPHLPQR